MCWLGRTTVLEAWRYILVNHTGNNGALVFGLPITWLFEEARDEVVGEVEVSLRELRER